MPLFFFCFFLLRETSRSVHLNTSLSLCLSTSQKWLSGSFFPHLLNTHEHTHTHTEKNNNYGQDYQKYASSNSSLSSFLERRSLLSLLLVVVRASEEISLPFSILSRSVSEFCFCRQSTARLFYSPIILLFKFAASAPVTSVARPWP